jgi:hypothetical protein
MVALADPCLADYDDSGRTGPARVDRVEVTCSGLPDARATV